MTMSHRPMLFPFEKLYEEGYRGLIFDIDNTLVPHGAPADERAKALFARLKAIGFSSCLISNNQEPPRKDVQLRRFRRTIFLMLTKPSTKNSKRGWRLWEQHQRIQFLSGTSCLLMSMAQNGRESEIYLVKPIHPKEEIQIVLKRYLEKIVLHFYRKEKDKRKK